MDHTINWNVVAPIIVASVAVITLFLKKYEILNLLNKNLDDRLESSIRYFKEFYNSREQNQIVLDRAAQELARCLFIDANLVNRLGSVDICCIKK